MTKATALLALLCFSGIAEAGETAADALVREYGLNTEPVTKVEDDVYETYYGNVQLVTHGCWVNAYRERAIVTSNQIIFVDANQTCDIWETRPKP